jgi:hypothetical protein
MKQEGTEMPPLFYSLKHRKRPSHSAMKHPTVRIFRFLTGPNRLILGLVVLDELSQSSKWIPRLFLLN